MKIIISHSNKKRVIEGSFELCASGDDLRSLIGCIQSKIGNGPFYGWIDIYDKPKILSNTPPSPWDDGSDEREDSHELVKRIAMLLHSLTVLQQSDCDRIADYIVASIKV